MEFDGLPQRSFPWPSRFDYVVSRAADLFLERGIAAVKMTDIADASGVGVATLYRNFSTKGRVSLAAATYLWHNFNERINRMIESDDFLALNGADRLERMLRVYSESYVENTAFVSFIDELDHMLLAGGAYRPDLVLYGREVDSFYIIFEDAYQLGRSDGSVVREVDFPIFYRSVAHALLGTAAKLALGEVIPSDNLSNPNQELECIVDMAVRSLR